MNDLLITLSQHPLLLLVYAGIFGLLIGSFLNVVILRLPARLEWQWNQEAREFLAHEDEPPTATPPRPPGLAVERSQCPKCGHSLSWWENIPLISFIALRGKCRACKTPISWQYPLVEALTAGLFIACAATFGATAYTLVGMVFCAVIVAASGIDARTTLLPDQLMYPLLWIGLAVAALHLPQAPSPEAAIAGAILGYLSLWSIYWLFKILTGKEGMGYGDFKLLAALGAWCGPASLLPIVLISTIAGSIIMGIAMKVAGKDRNIPFAFGPFLAIGGLVEFFARGRILEWLAH